MLLMDFTANPRSLQVRSSNTCQLPLTRNCCSSYSVGIRARAFLWIRKFLSNGYTTVRYNGVLSERRKVLPGVPQGLVLCSLLFIIYTMGLKNQLNETPVSIYADDIVLRCT